MFQQSLLDPSSLKYCGFPSAHWIQLWITGFALQLWSCKNSKWMEKKTETQQYSFYFRQKASVKNFEAWNFYPTLHLFFQMKLCSAQVLYFRSGTWIMEKLANNVYCSPFSADLSAWGGETGRDVSVRSECELLSECVGGLCVLAGSWLLASAQAVGIHACCCPQGRHLAAASSNLSGLRRVRSQQVCNWISHMSQSAVYCVVCEVCAHYFKRPILMRVIRIRE